MLFVLFYELGINFITVIERISSTVPSSYAKLLLLTRYPLLNYLLTTILCQTNFRSTRKGAFEPSLQLKYGHILRCVSSFYLNNTQ